MIEIKNSRFKLGQTVATAAATDKMESDPLFAPFYQSSLQRHCLGDWGWKPNESATETRESES